MLNDIGLLKKDIYHADKRIYMPSSSLLLTLDNGVVAAPVKKDTDGSLTPAVHLVSLAMDTAKTRENTHVLLVGLFSRRKQRKEGFCNDEKPNRQIDLYSAGLQL